MGNGSKKGFSLSEMLLAIVMLGVVYVILVPAVKNFMPDKYQTLYKKSYQSVLTAIRYAIMDKSLYVSQTPLYWADTTVNPATSTVYIDTQEFCKNIANNLNTIGTVDCSITGTADIPNFTLANGSIWWGLGNYKFPALGTNIIYIDLDGKSGKNTIGIDQLRMRVQSDGKVTTDPAWTLENSYLNQ